MCRGRVGPQASGCRVIWGVMEGLLLLIVVGFNLRKCVSTLRPIHYHGRRGSLQENDTLIISGKRLSPNAKSVRAPFYKGEKVRKFWDLGIALFQLPSYHFCFF